eukprot:16106902-Heterocapsa_arctica.AAC.1
MITLSGACLLLHPVDQQARRTAVRGEPRPLAHCGAGREPGREGRLGGSLQKSVSLPTNMTQQLLSM